MEAIGGDSAAASLHMAQLRHRLRLPLGVGVGAGDGAESTLINTMTNSKLSDIIFQIVIALLSDDYDDSGGRSLRRGELRCRWRWKWEMMKGTIGALISPGKVTTCVSEALLLLLLWLPFLFIIEMSVGRQTERKAEIKEERE